MPTLGPDDAPVDVLIVASWYPGVDDTARGRFVADQAEALVRTGRARPLVASFDPARSDREIAPDGGPAQAIESARRAAFAQRTDGISPRAWESTKPVPVARIPVAEGPGTGPSNDQQGDLRRRALKDFVDRLAVGPRGVVHAHTAYPDGYAAAEVAAQLGWPLVITEHATFVQRQLRRPAQRRGYLEAVGAASRFIAVSDALAEEMKALIPGLDTKLEVIPNAVAIEDFTPTGMADRNPEELLFIGYRRERKGIVTLLRAFADVLGERPNATLRLIGRSLTDEEEKKWRELADELAIAHAVRFDPPADRHGIAEAMRRASILVHASHRETFGITTVEALAAGLPVVAADAGGIASILRDKGLGELVPPQDSRYLARAILRTLGRRAEFDPQYLRAATEPFAGEKVAERLLAVYGELLPETHAIGGATAPATPDGRDRMPWAGRAEPLPPTILVLAANPARLRPALEALPAELRLRLTVVTRGGADEVGADGARVVDATSAVDTSLKRAGLQARRGGMLARARRLARDPLGPIRRRLVPGGVAAIRQAAVAAGIRSAAERAGLLETRPEVVCLEPVDYEAASPWVTGGRAIAAPGGILWVADRFTSLQGADQEAETAPSR